MRGKESNIAGKIAPLQNNFKDSLEDIDDESDTFSILISSSSMTRLSVPESVFPLLGKNSTRTSALRIASSSPVGAKVAQVEKVCQIDCWVIEWSN